MIPKGCCCKNSFSFPFDGNEVSCLYITYQEKGKTVIEKKIDDCTFKDGKVIVDLTQEETLSFDDNAIVRMQIRGKLKNGATIKSKIVETFTDEGVLKKEVI